MILVLLSSFNALLKRWIYGLLFIIIDRKIKAAPVWPWSYGIRVITVIR